MTSPGEATLARATSSQGRWDRRPVLAARTRTTSTSVCGSATSGRSWACSASTCSATRPMPASSSSPPPPGRASCRRAPGAEHPAGRDPVLPGLRPQQPRPPPGGNRDPPDPPGRASEPQLPDDSGDDALGPDGWQRPRRRPDQRHFDDARRDGLSGDRIHPRRRGGSHRGCGPDVININTATCAQLVAARFADCWSQVRPFACSRTIPRRSHGSRRSS